MISQTSRIEAVGFTGTTVSDETFAYDVRGLLAVRETREDGVPLQQQYLHDELGRLTDHAILPIGLFEYDYDERGNVTQNPTVGTLSYVTAGKPHAVSSTSDGRSFEYDAYGNQVLRDGPDGRQELDYTAFDLPVELREGPDSAPTRVTRFEYDASGTRIVREADDGDTTTYVSGLYRQEAHASTSAIDRIAMVALPDGRTLHVNLDESAPAERYEYEQLDHQGSVGALFDGVGTKTESRAYLPFGQPLLEQTGPVRAGYTGHEHDREQGLINMRGRMYDPAIGRFLTPDPLVQAGFGTQGFNPYSYVYNSPAN